VLESVFIKSELLRSEMLSALSLNLSHSQLFLSPLERASETYDSNLAAWWDSLFSPTKWLVISVKQKCAETDLMKDFHGP